jgi:hypothetical protein
VRARHRHAGPGLVTWTHSAHADACIHCLRSLIDTCSRKRRPFRLDGAQKKQRHFTRLTNCSAIEPKISGRGGRTKVDWKNPRGNERETGFLGHYDFLNERALFLLVTKRAFYPLLDKWTTEKPSSSNGTLSGTEWVTCEVLPIAALPMRQDALRRVPLSLYPEPRSLVTSTS